MSAPRPQSPLVVRIDRVVVRGAMPRDDVLRARVERQVARAVAGSRELTAESRARIARATARAIADALRRTRGG